MKQKSVEIKTRLIVAADIAEMVDFRIKYLLELQEIKAGEKYLEILKKELSGYFVSAVAKGEFLGIVAHIDGSIAGYGGMVLKKIPGDLNQPFYTEADILNMYTIPEFRNLGVGKKILSELENEAQKLKVSKLSLHTSKAGEKLYRSSGFSEPVYPFLEKIL